MLNVENINKNVEMLKTKTFLFDKKFKKSLLTLIFINIYSHL